ncbi:MAG: hypothetical protein Q9213_003114 [Squamulea squamosa]
MTDNASINDAILPITALSFLEDQSSTGYLLLAGEGPYLKVFDYRSGRLTTIKKIFETQAIHGIKTTNALDNNDHHLNGAAEVLFWGGRCVRRGLLRYSVAEQLVEIELQEVLSADDWILDGCFCPSIGADQSGGVRRQLDAVLVTAHNLAYAVCQDDGGCAELKRVVAGPDSMLYSAHIEWMDNGRILAASGTVFGEILVWSFPGAAVGGGDISSVSMQLHYQLTGHEGSVFGVRISPMLSGPCFKDGYRLLASCSDDRTIRLWDVSDIEANETHSSKESKETQGEDSPTGCLAMIMGHASRIWNVRFLVSGDEINVLSFGEDGTVKVWQVNSASSSHNKEKLSTEFMSHQRTYAYHTGKNIWASALTWRQHGGHTVCTGGADGRVVLYDILGHEEFTDGQVSKSKWTMQDVAVELLKDQTIIGDGATAPDLNLKKTLCEHVFDALADTWAIEREIKSALPTSPSGTFSGEAEFESRFPTAPEFDKEYLYIEDGKFTTGQGLTFTATRRYVYRYQRASDMVSVWFVKPDNNTVVDYLFHEIRLAGSNGSNIDHALAVDRVIKASSYHLCVKDHYTPTYAMHLKEGRLKDWKLAYQVKGPEKDYISNATYVRNEKVSSVVLKAKTLSGQISFGRHIERDSFRSYLFLTDESLLVTTAQGRVLIRTTPSAAGSECKAEPSEPRRSSGDRLTVNWKLVGQYDTLNSSSMLVQATFSNLVLIGGNDGTVFSYNRNKVMPVLYLERKIAFLYAQTFCSDRPGSEAHLILAVCLGLPVAFVYRVSDDELRDSGLARQLTKLSLPTAFVVTSACYLELKHVWVLGCRTGAVATYDGSTTEPVGIMTDIHGQDAVTVIQRLPLQREGPPPYILTAGRDGHYAVHIVTITSTQGGKTHVQLHTVHRSTPTFGPNVEGAAFDRRTQELILWGFRSKEFVVWNASRDMETMNVDCGGVHRNWCYNPSNDGSNGGTFVWTKASVCHVHSQSSASHQVLSSGGHGREIKAISISLALVEPDGSQYIATGSEDTIIRIWSYLASRDQSGSHFRCLETFRKHTTGIQQLHWSANGSLLFSAAGCEEFFVWRVQPVPFLGIGTVCEAVCPKVTDDGDLRVMDFAIVKAPCNFKVNERPIDKSYIISIVYSDSSLRVYRYHLSHACRSFELLQSGTYTTHCLTAASYISSKLCTASSDGHIALWSAGQCSSQFTGNEVRSHYRTPVHQNSIKSMFLIPLDTTSHDYLIVTGGDDGALGITRRALPQVSHQSSTATLLIPKAHAAAINAVEYLSILSSPADQSLQVHVFVSSGNDQRLKTWIVRIKGSGNRNDLIESTSDSMAGVEINADFGPSATLGSGPVLGGKPVIVGIYGISGCGKTFLLNQLKETLDKTKFAFYDGSEKIATMVPGGLENFQRMDKQAQMMWRQRAIDHIQEECRGTETVGIIAGHFMLWSEEEERALPVYTQNDINVYTHVLYLDVPASVVAQRRREDNRKARPNVTDTQLHGWLQEEKTELRSLCRDHGILFSALQHPLQMDKVSALLEDFRIHSEEHNLTVAKEKFQTHLKVNGEEQGIVLTMDADRTLAAEDTGALFWTAASQKWPSLVSENTLKCLFSGPLKHSHRAFRQATLLYEETANDHDFEELCQNVASQVTMYPDIIAMLHFMSDQKHVDIVVISSGLRIVWEKVLEREGLAKAVTVIGGGRIADGLVVTAAVKGHLVEHLRAAHGKFVWAFGDSSLDLPMLLKANRAIVVVGDLKTRSKTMDAELKDAIDKHGLRAHQVLLPKTVPPRVGLPIVQLTDPNFVSNLLGNRFLPRGPRVILATGTNATKLLATAMRDSANAGPDLKEAHRHVGRHLAFTYVAEIVGIEPKTIRHVLGSATDGFQLRHEKKTTIAALMRGGEPMASGVFDAFPLAIFVHAVDPEDIKFHHLEGQITLLLVDSIINTGKSILDVVQHVRSIHATIQIVIVAAVVQSKCVTGDNGGTLVQKLASFANVHIVALRVSETSFVGSRETDTGNRLFNTIHLD